MKIHANPYDPVPKGVGFQLLEKGKTSPFIDCVDSKEKKLKFIRKTFKENVQVKNDGEQIVNSEHSFSYFTRKQISLSIYIKSK